MSQENVEIVLAATRCFEAGDWAGYAELLDPEVRMTGLEGWPEPGPFIGRDNVVAQYQSMMAVLAEPRVAALEVLADDADWVVIEYRLEAQGASSGVTADVVASTATRVKNGRIVETHWHRERQHALAAARHKSR